jgi:hypothetical protein
MFTLGSSVNAICSGILVSYYMRREEPTLVQDTHAYFEY